MSTPSTDTEITAALAELPDWSGDGRGISASWTFADFPTAVGFMAACVDGIEERQHHPEWSNVYNTVRVTLCTHDAGDRVTGKDFDLARFLSQQASKLVGKPVG